LNDNCVVDVEFVYLECIYMSMFGVCTKLVENDVMVVKLWMNSWLNVVVVVMECVVDELMHWVFIIVDWWCELGCCWKFYENGLKMNKLILFSRIKLFMLRLMHKWLDDISMKNWVCLSLILNLARA